MYSSGLFVSAVSGGCSLSVSEQPAAKVSTARANSPLAHLENLPRRSITTEPIRKQHKIQRKPHTKQTRPPSDLICLSMSKCVGCFVPTPPSVNSCASFGWWHRSSSSTCPRLRFMTAPRPAHLLLAPL